MKLQYVPLDLMQQHPGLEVHPRLGGFSEKLNRLVDAIKELSDAVK